jgi:hypothetical protein
VKHQDPFYQIGKLYVYKLQVELFQYASEKIDTGIEEVDAFETLKTMNTDPTRSLTGSVIRINVTNQGSGYTSAPTVKFINSGGFGAQAVAILGEGSSAGKIIRVDVTVNGKQYQNPPTIEFIGGGGSGAQATAIIETDIDKIDSYGDNNKFKEQSNSVVFSSQNPFGEIDKSRFGD